MNLRVMRSTGFTLVELLIVIVVISILAAITAVAFNGVQVRSRDSIRIADITNIRKAIELYKADNAGYPQCGSSAAYQKNTAISAGEVTACLSAALVPQYVAALPIDPSSSSGSNYIYSYAAGCKFNPSNGFITCDQTQNYIIGSWMEGSSYNTAYTWNGYVGSGPNAVKVRQGTFY